MAVSAVVSSGRRLVAQTFLDRAYVRDRTKVRDTSGGWKDTWIERPAAIPCRFTQMRDDDPVINLSSAFGRATAILLVPLDVVCKEGDRVRNAAGDPTRSIWVITKDLTPPSELAIARRLGIAEVVT
jgi:hypothetical protein